jgi:predicted aspartyl protease
MLKKLGIKPEKTRKFRTMTGRAVRREVGEAVLECLGEKATSMIVFGRKGDAAVLGVVSLETLGLEVDPITEQLKKSEALLAL